MKAYLLSSIIGLWERVAPLAPWAKGSASERLAPLSGRQAANEMDEADVRPDARLRIYHKVAALAGKEGNTLPKFSFRVMECIIWVSTSARTTIWLA